MRKANSNVLSVGAGTRHFFITWQRHDMSASEYKERFGLNRSHAIITPALKERKREAVFENGTVENLKKGENTRFVKGDTRPSMKYERREETLTMLRKRNFKKQS